MIAVDTQILVYFQRKDSPWHQARPGVRARPGRGADAVGRTLALRPRVFGCRDASQDLSATDSS